MSCAKLYGAGMWIFLGVLCLGCLFCFSGCLHDPLRAVEKMAGKRAKFRFVARMNLSDAFSDANVEALAKAASKGNVDRISQLIAQGVDVNHQGMLGVTPLYWGLRNYKGFCALLEKGANPNVMFDDGSSVLVWAATMRDKRFLKTVLQHGGNPDFGEGEGVSRTPMHAAVEKNDLEAVDILLGAGANINVTDKFGDGGTPILSAIYRGNYKLARKLLDRVDSFTENQKNKLLAGMKLCKKNMIPGHPKERELSALIEIVSKKKTQF